MPDFAVKTAFTAIDKISPVFTKMSQSADKWDKKLNHVMHKVSRVGEKAIEPFKQFIPALGIAGVVEFGIKCIEVFEASEAAIANVEAGLESTHNKIGMNIDQFKDIAKTQMENGIFGKGDILQSATAQLLTFGGIGKENFERIQQAAMDVTAKLKGVNATGADLEDISIAMGKAMDNPAEGLTKLQRRGIMFTDQQKAQIKGLVAQGKLFEAQGVMLTEIESKYGGTSEALAMTAKGMELVKRHKMAENMAEIGEQLLPIKEELLEIAVTILPYIASGIQTVAPWIKRFAPLILAVVAAVIAWKIATKGLTIASNILFAAQLIHEGGFKTYLTMTKFATISQWLFNASLFGCPLVWFVAALAAVVAVSYVLIKNWNSWGAAMAVTLGPLGLAISYLKTFYDRWNQIKDAFSGGGIMAGLKEIGMAMLDSVLYPLQQILEIASSLPSGMGGDFAKAGAAKLKGFREGSLNAPNSTEVQSNSVNHVEVGVYNALPGTAVEVTPKSGAKVNMNLGANEAY